MTERPFRFALTVGSTDDRTSLLDTVRRADDAGFAVLAGVDHIGPPLGVIPMLAALAEITSLRLSPMVIANDYRHPLQLARDAATIDILSQGRFELGLGTGWIKAQYDSVGIPYDPPKTRVDRLEEAIAVIKGCWSGAAFSFAGEHYTIDLTDSPQPVQQPGPPLLIAGSGPRMLRLAGREADIVGITVTRGMSGFSGFVDAMARAAENIETQLAAVRAGAGERFNSLELSVMVHHYLDDRQSATTLGSEVGVHPDVVMRSPHILSGSTAEMVDALQERRERFGLSYVAIRGVHLDVMTPVVRRLAGT